MGLSERKSKQRIGNDPRNLAWRHDTTSFGAQMLAKAGHTPGTSLGLSENGLINPIAAARKIDSSGIGMGRARREGGIEGGGVGSAGGNLDDLLRRLREAEGGESSSGSEAPQGKVMSGFARAATGSGNTDTVIATEEVSSPAGSSSTTTTTSTARVVLGRPNRMAHRNKFRNAKQLASQQNALAMSEILGIPSPSPSSPYDSPRDSPAPSGSEAEASASANDFGNDLIAKNKGAQSVQDYFKAKMEAKKAAMAASIAAAANGGVAPAAVQTLETAVAFEEPLVVEQHETLAQIVPAPAAEAQAESSGSSSESEDDEEEAAPAPIVEDKRKKDKGKGKAVDAEAASSAAVVSPKESEKAEKKRLRKEAKQAAKEERKAAKAAAKEEKRAAKEAAKAATAVPIVSEPANPAEDKKSKKSKKRSAEEAVDESPSAEKTEKKSKKSKRRKDDEA